MYNSSTTKPIYKPKSMLKQQTTQEGTTTNNHQKHITTNTTKLPMTYVSPTHAHNAKTHTKGKTSSTE
jgi:hypothetical protein